VQVKHCIGCHSLPPGIPLSRPPPAHMNWATLELQSQIRITTRDAGIKSGLQPTRRAIVTGGFIFPLLSTPDVSSTGSTQRSTSKGALPMLKVAVQGASLLILIAHLLTVIQETRGRISQEETRSRDPAHTGEESRIQNPAQSRQETGIGRPAPKTEAPPLAQSSAAPPHQMRTAPQMMRSSRAGHSSPSRSFSSRRVRPTLLGYSARHAVW
jgi:hypothetical protein